jgi:SEC-C motif-containing protein
MIRATDPCPCGGARYGSCCGPFHAGEQAAPTAERLMRSRYSAYVLAMGDYLFATWHPGTRPTEPLHFEPGLKWLGLEVREHQPTGEDRAEVLFVARSKLGGRAHRLVERSRFVREGGRWFYVDGDVAA